MDVGGIEQGRTGPGDEAHGYLQDGFRWLPGLEHEDILNELV
jgi:hypothetical protein